MAAIDAYLKGKYKLREVPMESENYPFVGTCLNSYLIIMHQSLPQLLHGKKKGKSPGEILLGRDCCAHQFASARLGRVALEQIVGRDVGVEDGCVGWHRSQHDHAETAREH